MQRGARYDPAKHHRRSIRLRGYDYSQPGAYFVTIVTHQRECLFENIVLRRVAETYWRKIPQHFPNVILDEWVVMPNHLHGIIIITDDERRGEAFPPDTFDGTTIARAEDTYASNGVLGNASPLPPRGVASRSLGAIIGNYKSVTARRINTIRHTSGAPVWQRNYWEHIIRDENEMNRIREYIINNPANWGTDNQNPARVSRRSR